MARPCLRIHQDHVQKEHVAGLHWCRVAFVEHREFDPDRIVGDAHAIAAGVQSGVGKAMPVEGPGVGIEYIAHRIARSHDFLTCHQRLNGRRMHTLLLIVGWSDNQGAHHCGVISSPCA